ncbi:MAG: hypothetical protein H6Q41_3625 [Deltaproteobacteria bacterium]|jgi:hypothetical protein|nr:hypothetical protein [Deltaproteobacteria bacterium]
MNTRLSILIVFIVLFYFSFVQTYPCLGRHFSKGSLSLLAKNDESPATKEDSRPGPIPAIEEYERQKLAKLRQNVGKRFMTAPTVNPAEFYASPDDLGKKLRVKKEKEAFGIVEVVQNRLGTMNFYQVKFDSGEVGYLGADGNNLEIEIKKGSLISLEKKTGTRNKSLSQSKALASQAIELVKNHPTLADSATGRKRSVETRMKEEQERSFPNLKWRYESKKVGKNKYRITQYAREGGGPPLVRTWTVDLSKDEVIPENLAAKQMYRQ